MRSMDTMKFFGALALTALLGTAACDGSDEPESDEAPAGTADQVMPQQEMDPETMAQVVEIQEIQARLEPVQRQALEDEALASRMEALQVRIEEAMRSENPQVADRMDGLRAELADAQASGDQQRMQELMQEAQSIQQDVQALQASVLERPEIRQAVEEFEAAYRARMIEIDPEAESLLERMDELVAQLPR